MSPTLKGDLRKTRRYQAVRLIVLQQEPECWLRFAKCERWSTTADHVIPVRQCMDMGRPDLVTDRANLRGACGACNYGRHDAPIDAITHLRDMAPWFRTPLRVFD